VSLSRHSYRLERLHTSYDFLPCTTRDAGLIADREILILLEHLTIRPRCGLALSRVMQIRSFWAESLMTPRLKKRSTPLGAPSSLA
jgi:hypothetical protein